MEHLPQSVSCGQAHANGACISIVYYSHLSPVWNEGGEKHRILQFEKQPPQKSHCSSKIPFVVSAGANPSSHQTYWYPPWSEKKKLYFCKKDRTQNHFIVQFNNAQLRQQGSAFGHLAAAIFRRPWPRVRKGHMRFVFLICAYPIQRFRLQSGIRSIPPLLWKVKILWEMVYFI